MEQIQYPAGAPIFEEGDQGDTAFLVASGMIEISRYVDGKKSVLGNIATGQLFGEMALITDQPRMATAIAKDDAVCFVIPPEVFEKELGDTSAFLKSLVFNLIGHIRSLSANLDDMQNNAPADDKAKAKMIVPDKNGNYQ